MVSLDPNRYEYGKKSLDLNDLLADPSTQLETWLKEAHQAQVLEPDAMCLSTVAADGRPSARMVLLRGLDARGLVFYTNYDSRKGHELAANPHGCVTFWWGALERQVRVEGVVSPLPASESDAYFASRPRQSRLASAASPQSRVVDSREELDELVERLDAQYAGDVPRPSHWGGYVLAPDRFEFWQGRPARLHDRLAYTRTDGEWRIERLAP